VSDGRSDAAGANNLEVYAHFIVRLTWTNRIDTTLSNMKRKTLHDYFALPTTSTTKADLEEISDPVGTAPSKTATFTVKTLPIPDGLSTIPSFITENEERALLDFLDQQHWRTDLARRTMHYGGTYCLMPPRDASPAERKKIEQTIIAAPVMPASFDFLIDRMVSCGLYAAVDKPAYCIVNEYLPGHGISAHVENFRFGEPVCSLTLAAGDAMRFHELESANDGSVRSGKASAAPRTGRRQDVFLPRRSLVILRDDARSRWQHEIVRGRRTGKATGWRRVSLTFRVEKNHDRKSD